MLNVWEVFAAIKNSKKKKNKKEKNLNLDNLTTYLIVKIILAALKNN